MQDRCSQDDLLLELQTMLAALADVEFRYDDARDHLEAWEGPQAIEQHFFVQLKEHHQRQRERFDQRLAELQYAMMRIMTLEDICLNA